MTKPLVTAAPLTLTRVAPWLIAIMFIAVIAVIAGCRTSSESRAVPPRNQGVAAPSSNRHEIAQTPVAGALAKPEATSLLGRPLYSPALPDDVRNKREQQRADAQADYDRNPHDESAIIWLARRQAYLGQFNDAINTFSNGLAILPDSFRLLRHRGHRYITVRKFDLAIADLERAAKLIDGLPDEIEPDGQPNTQNIPTSTTHTNIYYHLALAHYLKGGYAAAERVYRRCMEYSKNDDMRVATAYWLFLTLKRQHKDNASGRVLNSVSDGMNIIENTGYHRLLLHFKGEMPRGEVETPTGEDASVDLATVGYGLGAWDLVNGRTDDAMMRFSQVVESTNWAAFGHIAAEAELARRSTLTHPPADGP